VLSCGQRAEAVKSSSFRAAALALLIVGSGHPRAADAQSDSVFRVSIMQIRCTTPTMDSPLAVDGAGDEIGALTNVLEVGPANAPGPLKTVVSALYADTSGHTLPFSFFAALEHPGLRLQAGHASRTGGMRAGDAIPDLTVPRPTGFPRTARARMIPMIVWEGHLRSGPTGNGVLIVPTVWEVDFVPELQRVWNNQIATFLKDHALHSAAFTAGTERRSVLAQTETALRWVPNQIFFDRPVGMGGGYFVPGAAAPVDATFVPGMIQLNYENAVAVSTSTAFNAARQRGVIDIVYKDSGDYGPGDYTIAIRVERTSF
jgi:hypothetical protein